MSKMTSNTQDKGIPSDPCSLRELSDYQAGSIVSRTLMEKSTGTITLFAFDKDQGLSEHPAPFDALVQVVDGEVQLTIGGEAIHATAGQLVLMPANVPHAVLAKKRLTMLLTMIRG